MLRITAMLQAECILPCVQEHMDYVEEVTLEVAEFTSLEEQAAAADGDKKPAATDGDASCVVCLVESKDHAFVPCGHMCACEGCATEIQNTKNPTCPMCRSPFASVIKVFS